LKKALTRLFFFILIIGAIFIAKLFLFPQTYNVVQMQKRESTKFWNLSSGSIIAYTLAEGKKEKMPYPVIFLQGGPGGPIYNRNIEILSRLSEYGFDVYLYDQVGSGFSKRLENISDYTAERHKKDLEEIIDIIGSEKVILIGQSWGAILAVLYTADNPDRVDKIVFTGPGPIFPINKKLANLQAPDSLNLKSPLYSNAMANSSAQNFRIRFISFLAKTFGVKLASDREVDDFQTYLNFLLSKSTVCDTTKVPRPEAGGGFYAQLMTVNSLNEITNPRPKLRNSPIPILVMKGQCDNQKWGYTNEYLETFPNHRLIVVPAAGHSISIEQPEIYIQTIREFLTGQ